MPTRIITLPPPVDGVDYEQAPHHLPPTRTRHLTNALVHEAGKLPMRAGLLGASPTLVYPRALTQPASTWGNYSGNHIPISVHENGNLLLRGYSKGNKWHPWRIFEAAASVTATPEPLGNVEAASSPSSPNLTFTTRDELAAGPHSTHYEGTLYYIEYDVDPVAYINYGGKQHYRRGIRRVKVSTSDDSLDPADNLGTGVPIGAQGVAAYANRLFVLGGTPPGTFSPLKPNTLWFTNAGVVPVVNNADSFKVNGVNNFITVGAETERDWGVQLAATSRYLLIFKRHSVWVLTGQTLDQFQLREVLANEGLVDPRAVAVVGDEVFFLTASGLQVFDGARVSPASTRINPRLVPLLSKWASESAPLTGYATLQRYVNNYLVVSVGQDGVGTHGCWALHVPSGRWVEWYVAAGVLALDTGARPWPALSGRIGDRVFAVNHTNEGGRTWEATYVTDPGRLGLAGSTQAARDQDRGSSGVTVAKVDLVAHFAPVRSEAPGERTQLLRVGLEGLWQCTATPGSTVGQPQLYLDRYSVAGLQSEAAINAGNNVLEIAARVVAAEDLRPQIEWAQQREEFTDLELRVQRAGVTSGYATMVRAELLGAQLEVQAPTHQRVG